LLHEWGPSWVKVDVGPPTQGAAAWTTPEGAGSLQSSLQAMLDALHAQDTAWAAPTSSCLQQPGWLAGGPAQSGFLAEQSPEQLSLQQQQDDRQVDERWSQWSLAGSSPDRSMHGGAATSGRRDDSSIQQQLLAAAAGHMLGEPADGLSTGAGPCGLGGLTRLVLRLDRVLTDDTSALRPAGSAVALFEVWPEPIRRQVGPWHWLLNDWNQGRCKTQHIGIHPEVVILCAGASAAFLALRLCQ
jgi:hypothetical protein